MTAATAAEDLVLVAAAVPWLPGARMFACCLARHLPSVTAEITGAGGTVASLSWDALPGIREAVPPLTAQIRPFAVGVERLFGIGVAYGAYWITTASELDVPLPPVPR